MSPKQPPRVRKKPNNEMGDLCMSKEEERLLRQAIENSKRTEHMKPGGKDMNVPPGPTFYPTVEEFEGNPLTYINKIRPIAEKYGVCKIVPPQGWNPPFCIDMESDKKFETKLQLLHHIQEGVSFGDGREYTAKEYIQMAIEKTKSWIAENVKDKDDDVPTKVSPEYLEEGYWDIVELGKQNYEVEYGNDVDSSEFGSGFPKSDRGRDVGGIIDVDDDGTLPEPKFGTDEFYKESYWNLNNISLAPDSILQYVKVGINGINVPWLYFGNLFSTFCWHNEDNYLYSINYNHFGAPKLWYGVPGSVQHAEGLERVFKSYLSLKMRDVPDLLHHITTMFSPRLLEAANVPVYKLVQHPGEFVVTFPRSFHGGFSLGPNIGEAVNFATHDWIVHGADANERYRSFARPAVFSHDRLTFTMANHLEDQKSYTTCKLLLDELKRIANEERRLRSTLLRAGVRDVSEFIQLPPNRLDQLDEKSADYDEKRLCFSCKHVCFFSCVACECSKSKVSCLRHSHFMCRCPIQKKYMMIWSSIEELQNVQDAVEDCARSLKAKLGEDVNAEIAEENDQNDLPPFAPGSIEDHSHHSSYYVDLDKDSPISKLPRRGFKLIEHMSTSRSNKIHEVTDDDIVREQKRARTGKD
jgi:histone demethylase JARID1